MIYTQCAVVETMILVNKSCVKVEVAVLGSPSLTVWTVSMDVKQQRRSKRFHSVRHES